ncbi:MAG: c-type cytochrome [Cyanobacteria bacterium]|nr:c-type cytochrome [Cyanobacteriota bacterium]
MLKKQFLQLIAIVTVFAAMLSFTMPAYATDAEAGGKVFAANCAACHARGRNAVNPAKTLQKAALEKYKMYSEAAIITQVTNGKNAMPAFGKKLQSEQIENVAAYILAQADKNWAK